LALSVEFLLDSSDAKHTGNILQARVTNTILPDFIPWKSAILFLYSERTQHRSTT